MVFTKSGLAAVVGSTLLFWSCSSALAAAVEQKVYSLSLGDFEFDSARDGTYCASCNFGSGNSRVTYVDAQFRMWVTNVDFVTGLFNTVPNALQLVDTNAAVVTDFGNGPSWMFSTKGSELVYTRYQDGQPHSDATAGVAQAKETGPAKWAAGFISGGLGRVAPKGTENETDTQPRMSYGNVSQPLAYWRNADPSGPEVTLPGDGSNTGIGLRWVDGTNQILYSIGQLGTDDQIFVQDVTTGVSEQITTGAGEKLAQSLVNAPEYGGEPIFFVVVDKTHFDLYRKLPDSNGILKWTYFRSISPPAEFPSIAGSPEAFVYNGQTWIVLTLKKSSKGATAASNIAIVSLNTTQAEWRLLTDDTSPARWRSDPEYFINDTSVYVYYTRTLPDIRPTVGEGTWRVDTGLGPKTQ